MACSNTRAPTLWRECWRTARSPTEHWGQTPMVRGASELQSERMELWFTFIELAPTIFTIGAVATILAEITCRWVTGRSLPLRQWALSSFAGFSFVASKHVVGYALVIPLHLHLYQFRIFDLDLLNPLTWLAIFLLRDLVSYWVHRGEHRIQVLWASHSIHHSFEEMSPSCAMRVPWMETVYKAPATLWMPFLGVDIRLVIGVDVIAALVSILQHTELFPARSSGVLQRWFIVPSHHRVHHGSNDLYLDRNFGAVLCIWDRMFGTFQAETEQARYGVLGRPLDSPRDMVLGKYPDLASAAWHRGLAHR